MRTLGLDVGSKTIGVALSDAFGWTAQGITTIKRVDNLEKDLLEVKDLCKKNEVTKVVLGLPLNMDGTMGKSAENIKKFGTELDEYLKNNLENSKIDIIYHDERLSTVEAERVLIAGDMSRNKRKKVIDKVAAVIILQNYLDMQG